MGNCAAQTEDQMRSKELDREINTSNREVKKELKLLLLGTGESGKTTVIKQLRIIHTGGFSEDELDSWKESIHSNIITSMSALIKALEKKQSLSLLTEDEQDCARLITSPKILTYTALVPEVTHAVRTLWNCPSVKERFNNKSDVQIIDSASYFFEEIERIADPNYKPTSQDVLQARVRTTGITEVMIPLGANRLRLVDVGGQRSERRKWIHCFQEVTGILYLSAVSEFDQKLREDDTTNRVEESLNLFREVVGYDWFRTTPVILLLNKKDLLEKKLARVNLRDYYPDYAGPQNELKPALEYFKEMFQRQVTNRTEFFHHFTEATDTGCIKLVFHAIQNILLKGTITETGIDF